MGRNILEMKDVVKFLGMHTDHLDTWIPKYGIIGGACLVFRPCRLWSYILQRMPLLVQPSLKNVKGSGRYSRL